MYGERELLWMKNRLRNTILLICAVFVFFLLVSILTAKWVDNTLGKAIMVAGVCVIIFTWGVYGSQIRAYYRFLEEIAVGKSRRFRGEVIKIGSQPVYKDNRLFFYELLVREDGVDRMLLMDIHNVIPGLEEGSTYDFEIYENYIIGIDKLKE